MNEKEIKVEHKEYPKTLEELYVKDLVDLREEVEDLTGKCAHALSENIALKRHLINLEKLIAGLNPKFTTSGYISLGNTFFSETSDNEIFNLLKPYTKEVELKAEVTDDGQPSDM